MAAPVRPRARQRHRGRDAAAGATARQASAWRRQRDLRPAPDHRAPDRGDSRHAGYPASHGSWPAIAPGLASATRNAGYPCGPSWPCACPGREVPLTGRPPRDHGASGAPRARCRSRSTPKAPRAGPCKRRW